MKEYIEKEALLKIIDEKFSKHYRKTVEQSIHDFHRCVQRQIQKAPAADVVEVKRGRWIEHEWAEEENGVLVSNFECSACHVWERKTSDYCPTCGADMREPDHADHHN